MDERVCCACRAEVGARPVGFPLLRTTYFLGPMCWGAWRINAMSLGAALFNPAQVHMAFRRWLETRKAAA